MDGKYPALFSLVKKLLLVSHGQARVESGFSTNKEIEVENLAEEGLQAQRRVCDGLNHYGGPLNFPINQKLMQKCQNARSVYRNGLEKAKVHEAETS